MSLLFRIITIVLLGLFEATTALHASESSECSVCNDSKQFCGTYDSARSRWITGQWYLCNIEIDHLTRSIAYCDPCDPVSGTALCGLRNAHNGWDTGRWHACYDALPSGSPPINAPLVYDPNHRENSPNAEYDPSRSAFNPDGTRSLENELRNETIYGNPYDTTNLSERLIWCPLYGTSGEEGC